MNLATKLGLIAVSIFAPVTMALASPASAVSSAHRVNHQVCEVSGHRYCIGVANLSTGTPVRERRHRAGPHENLHWSPTHGNRGHLVWNDATSVCVGINTSNWVTVLNVQCPGTTGDTWIRGTRNGHTVYKSAAGSAHWNQATYLRGDNNLRDQYLIGDRHSGGAQRFQLRTS